MRLRLISGILMAMLWLKGGRPMNGMGMGPAPLDLVLPRNLKEGPEYPGAVVSRTRQSISVAVVALAALGRRGSSRPVCDAIGDIRFYFPGPKRREDSNCGAPAGILNPLRGSRCRHRGENGARE